MKKIFKKTLFLGCSILMLASCGLDEYDPAGGTGGQKLYSFDGWSGMETYCYEPLYGQLYSSFDFMSVSELGTDIWECANNKTWAQQLFYYEGLTTNTNASNKVFTQAYSCINSCNAVIEYAKDVQGGDPASIKTLTAEAKFLRAFYYSILVTYYGNVTLTLKPTEETGVNYRPERSTYPELYTQMVKDLKEAAADLPVKPYMGQCSRATKKAALGLLARVYAQGAGDADLKEGDVSYWQRAKEVSEDLIKNAASYDAYLYDDVADMWAQANNRNNKEALFLAVGPNPDANAINQRGNNIFGYMGADPNKAASDIYSVKKNQNYLYGRYDNAVMAPSKYLIDLYNAKYDKRWQQTFTCAFGWSSWVQTTSWNGSYDNPKPFVWTNELAAKYGKDNSVIGKTVYPYADFNLVTRTLSNQYVAKVWPKGDHSGNIADLETPKNVYVDPEYPLDPQDDRFMLYLSKDKLTDAQKASRIQATVNIDDLFDKEGKYIENSTQLDGKTELYKLFPACSKYNWNYDGAYYSSNLQKKNGDIAIIRMAEMYLIAAEAEQKLGNGAAAAGYLNVLRKRACYNSTDFENHMKLTTASEQDVLDEYARELCGEFQRWGVLKRHHCLKQQLEKGNIRAYRNFDEKKNYLRPISYTFLNQIENADEYGTNGY
ncbi:MAG: RagB/SusD family nutrient uptake outer membrane protein [Prevotella sp.]|jgi:hypothetical protein|nr:RagB/SusD family nutrient uptake outer membrane protein [Prevotella sp.]MCH4211522.1 RagB/SusD family nutrient uptake outer membrane protein [Prevotella sp.]MCH4240405.1 RagB/SusD family nutrient uptake outer membrane protein [Prevotella sp.]MCI1741098.1 RagB/SusD family nutrient uptake outer membrane protein [Prevotella sp.]